MAKTKIDYSQIAERDFWNDIKIKLMGEDEESKYQAYSWLVRGVTTIALQNGTNKTRIFYLLKDLSEQISELNI